MGENYNGPYITFVVIPPKPKKCQILPVVQFELPELKCKQRHPVSILKYENLQDLQRFYQDSEATNYYKNLPYSQSATK